AQASSLPDYACLCSSCPASVFSLADMRHRAVRIGICRLVEREFIPVIWTSFLVGFNPEAGCGAEGHAS
ncbi:MAG TPA: hypothetical protein VFD93_06265, partial [Candidatus Acidoferrales bacterium]|nr:hypothetical protein [Candidatus Acidoferrales bacterium]